MSSSNSVNHPSGSNDSGGAQSSSSTNAANTASLLSTFSPTPYKSQTNSSRQRQQTQPNYYTSSTSNVRDTDTAKKLPPLGLMSASANSLANNLFAYNQSDKSGLSTPQETLSASSSRSASTAGPDHERSRQQQSQKQQQHSGGSYQQQIHDNPLFTLANSVGPLAKQDQSPEKQQEVSQAAAAVAAMQWNSKVPDFALKIAASGASVGGGGQQSLQQSLPPQSVATAAVASLPGFQSQKLTSDDEDDKSGKPKKYVCTFPNCGKTFSRRMNLKSHIQSSHEHRKPFQCSVCLRTFARHSDRRRHENNQHKNTSGFVCGGLLKNGQRWGCGKVFKRKDGLMAHWRSQKARKKCLKNVPSEVQPMLDILQNDTKPVEFA
ncbi:DEKNAAC105194 [Brettanomyces naardenensis]|uniref:DEKNAAC105194 n=1 Tax=Brettanomyces naardenensis TaxID=13370 RepID=A0A448YSM7_BRENA|nr:DEKNAAC105194 [Brettanomyces naardenensis]